MASTVCMYMYSLLLLCVFSTCLWMCYVSFIFLLTVMFAVMHLWVFPHTSLCLLDVHVVYNGLLYYVPKHGVCTGVYLHVVVTVCYSGSTRSDKEVRVESAKMALVSMLKSWPGKHTVYMSLYVCLHAVFTCTYSPSSLLVPSSCV